MKLTSDKLGKLQTTFTVVKSGVDLKARFKKVLARHSHDNLGSESAQELIAFELYEQVLKDVS